MNTAAGGRATDFVDVRDLEDAWATLDERGPTATVLAGGTDVMAQYLRGDSSPPTLLHIRNVSGMSEISADGRTHIGALTTHRQLATSGHLHQEHRSLAEAAATVGGRQTQNVGTIAGNIVNASPAADLLPALLVADAEVSLGSSRGARVMSVADFVVGRRQTAIEPGELVTGFTLQRPGPRTGDVYLKVGRRGAMEVAVVGLAARVTFTEDRCVADARVAVCSVAPVPFRASEAEAVLAGSRLEDDVVAEAGRLLAQRAQPIDDVRASAAYRRRVMAPLLGRALGICAQRAGLPTSTRMGS